MVDFCGWWGCKGHEWMTPYIMRCIFIHHSVGIMHQKSQQGIQKNFVSEFSVLSALKLRLCEIMAFADMNMCILIEGRHLKTFVNENYAIVTYLVKKCLNIILIVLLEFA